MDITGETVRSITSWMTQNYLYTGLPVLICGLIVVFGGWRIRNWLMVLAGVCLLCAYVTMTIGSYFQAQKQY